jgi:hypothetical protein
MACTAIANPAAPPADTWGDNFVCTTADIGLRFSSTGPVAGLSCVRLTEPSDDAGGSVWSTTSALCWPG